MKPLFLDVFSMAQIIEAKEQTEIKCLDKRGHL